MRRILFSSVVFLLLVCLYAVLSAADKYDGDISRKEKRIRDYKKEIKDISYQFPSELRLIFKEVYGDYAVFYDLNNDEVFYKYRRDKFNYDAKKKLSALLKGQSYKIIGEYSGIAVWWDYEIIRKEGSKGKKPDPNSIEKKLETSETIKVTKGNKLVFPIFYLKDEQDILDSYDQVRDFKELVLEQIVDRDAVPVFRLTSYEPIFYDHLILR